MPSGRATTEDPDPGEHDLVPGRQEAEARRVAEAAGGPEERVRREGGGFREDHSGRALPLERRGSVRAPYRGARAPRARASPGAGVPDRVHRPGLQPRHLLPEAVHADDDSLRQRCRLARRTADERALARRCAERRQGALARRDRLPAALPRRHGCPREVRRRRVLDPGIGADGTRLAHVPDRRRDLDSGRRGEAEEARPTRPGS